MINLLSLVVIIMLSVHVTAQVSCLNREGEPVDWFVGYKLPHLEGRTSNGLGFLYADERSANWNATEDINSTDCAITRTLAQFYHLRGDKKTFYALYNDEIPDSKKTSSYAAHAKGVAVFGEETGFWLIHSVPKFPPPFFYEYSANGIRYGQSFLCITMQFNSLGSFAQQMDTMDPQVYQCQVPDAFSQRFPALKKLIPQRTKTTHNGTSTIVAFKSAGGATFTSFSKSRKYGKDLYADLMAPKLKISLNVETWMNGGGDLPSECDTTDKVRNVKKLRINGVKFLNSHDHSKWAIAETSTLPIVCVGDINRQESQKKRGGGSVCFADHGVWSLYDSSVVQLESCQKKKQMSMIDQLKDQFSSILQSVGINI